MDTKALWTQMIGRSWNPRQWFDGEAGASGADAGATCEEGRTAMWVFRPLSGASERRWAVGFYEPSGAWVEESVHADRDQAAARVHYLNGGQVNVTITPAERLAGALAGT